MLKIFETVSDTVRPLYYKIKITVISSTRDVVMNQ